MTKLKGKRILVAEDEALVAMLIEHTLLEAGAEVTGPAATVDHALSLVATAPTEGGIDAAILDVNLGGQMVTPAADKLAELGIPFVFATGYGEKYNSGRDRSVPVLPKPFDPEALVAILAALLR